MATEQTIPISGTPTVVSGVTVPYVKTSDLEIYVGQDKVEKVVLNNAGAGYDTVSNAALEFSGGGGSSAALTVDVANGQVSLDNAGVPTNKGSGYTTAPIVGFGNISGGTGAAATAEIYVKKTAVTDYSISGTSGSATITFTSNLSDDVTKVLVKRVTGVSTAANTFAAGTAITATDLNNSFNQIRHRVEELPEVTSTALTNGDKGDITVSGNNWTINTSAVEHGMLTGDCIDGDNIQDDVINSEHYVAGSIDLEHMSANSVDSDQYVDGSIDLVHMSANSVDSDQYVDGSIDTVHIADNQITPSKTNLSIIQGDIVYGTADDTWDRLAKGTAGQQLRTNKLASAPEWFTPNIQSNVYVKGYGIASGGITNPAAAATVSGDLTARQFHDTPVTVTITPQISSSLILLSTSMSYETAIEDYRCHFRIKAEVLNSSNVVQSTSYLTNNYNGSAIHNSGDGSSGYENKGANLHVGIEGTHRVPTLHPGSPTWHVADAGTPASLNIPSLLHTHGINTVSTSNKIKYTVQIYLTSASVVYINRTRADTDTTTHEYERGVSWFTAQETMGTITVDI